MTETILSLSNVINITIQSTPQNLNVPDINTAALISQEVPIVSYGSAVFKIYTNAADVETDFGGNSDAFAIATAFFAQQPNPLSTGGYLAIIPRLQTPSLESIQEAIARTLNSVFYFGVLVDEEIASTPFAALTAYIQTLDKMFFYGSSIQADYAPGGILDLLRTASKTHSRGLYYGGENETCQQYAAAYCARGLSTDFEGSNTTITMNLKTLAIIEPDPTIDQTQLEAAYAAGVDVYVNIAGLPSLFTSGANQWFDEIYNEFAFKFALQTAGFNYLRGAGTKIPQTEPGMEGLKNVYRKICDQFVSNGFIGAGAWDSSSVFGNTADLIRAVAGIGYYVYSLPVAQQSTASRVARQAPLVQIAIKAQGAIQKSNVIVNVNL